MLMRQIALALFALAAIAAAPAAPASAQSGAASTIDDQARLLAGLPVSPASPLVALESSEGAKAHAADLAKTWTLLKTDLLDKMRAWSDAELPSRVNAAAPLYYVFGGPDFLMANVMFPSAPVYILTGLEPPGRVPALETLKPDQLALGLKNLRDSMTTLPSKSYFITSYMARDFQRTELKGVMPVLYLFLARTGNQLLESELIYLDASGQAKTAPRAIPPDGVPGIRIVFRNDSQPAPQTLYYFSIDLEPGPLKKKPGFFPFLAGFKGATAYLKAASFILHNNTFSATRDFLLEHSAAILQDDSGIPFKSFAKSKWDFTFFGIYSPAIWIPEFKWVTQPDLQAAFEAATPVKPLPFKTGYSKADKSNLLLAVAKKAAPAGGIH
jgi:hypothetical protein